MIRDFLIVMALALLVLWIANNTGIGAQLYQIKVDLSK